MNFRSRPSRASKVNEKSLQWNPLLVRTDILPKAEPQRHELAFLRNALLLPPHMTVPGCHSSSPGRILILTPRASDVFSRFTYPGRFNPVYRQTHERTNSLERRLRKAMIRLPHSGNLNELIEPKLSI
ncbi:unnamed protein product [Nesidiocoris tenuis]|uniref:Uncharacterized protein n=1 Tax=Nesidiocoris tenuis TaxID=355587 RepID=A0A6H5FYI8_9HEMI|nr:unnamed protein product [Nesidiocoris tenuis]